MGQTSHPQSTATVAHLAGIKRAELLSVLGAAVLGAGLRWSSGPDSCLTPWRCFSAGFLRMPAACS